MGTFVIGDNEYVCSEILLTPLSCVEKYETMKDAFNFSLSQLRNYIEQTFGIMKTNWRIRHQSLKYILKKLRSYPCALQDFITSVLMRFIFLQSMQMTIKEMVLDLFHLIHIWNKYCGKFCASGYHSSRIVSAVTGRAIN